tara:strand:- start:139 stop:468 length:330 start_codon:yes stop_codon:yes gene_type:complete
MTVDRGRIIVYEKGILEVKVYTIDEFDDKLGNDLLIRWDTVEAKQGLFMLNTCVGHIKQLLGINRPFIWTPYQLYRYLGGIYVVHEETEGANTFSSRTSDNEETDSRAR